MRRKPHLRLHSSGLWQCSSIFHTACGYTVSQAYENWKSKHTKLRSELYA
jgi:hypothetical protein